MKFAALLLASALGGAAALTEQEVASIFCKDTYDQVTESVQACDVSFVTLYTDPQSDYTVGTTLSQSEVDGCIAECNAALDVTTCGDFDEVGKIDLVFECLVPDATTTVAATTIAAATTIGADSATTDGTGTGTSVGDEDSTPSSTEEPILTELPDFTTAAPVRRKLDIIRRRRLVECANEARVDNAEEIACVLPCPENSLICGASATTASMVAGVVAVVAAVWFD